MFCSDCGAKNEATSQFCTKCGKKLHTSNPVDNAVEQPQPVTASSRKNINLKQILLAIVGVCLVGSAFLGAQLYADFNSVNGQIEKVLSLQSSGQYEQIATEIDTLRNSDIWIPSWKEEEIDKIEQQNIIDVRASNDLNKASEHRSAEEYTEAREILLAIPTEFSNYYDVSTELAQVQAELEQQLVEEAEQKTKEAEAARAQADASAATARRAQQERAAAEAAAASTARQAEEDAAAAAGIVAAEAFIDETVTIYNSLVNAQGALSTALDYGIADTDNLIYHANRASSILTEVKERSENFYNYRAIEGYEEIPVWLYSAAEQYEIVITKIYEIGSETYDSSPNEQLIDRYIEEGNSAYDTGDYYASLVSEWLTSVGR